MELEEFGQWGTPENGEAQTADRATPPTTRISKADAAPRGPSATEETRIRRGSWPRSALPKAGPVTRGGSADFRALGRGRLVRQPSAGATHA